jgi:hypothetical protein
MKSLLQLLIIFVISIQVRAQIVYTDVDPDVTVNEFQQGYGVDFDNDGHFDLHVTLLSNTGVWVMHLIWDSSLDNVYVVYDGEEASILELNDEISPSSNWYKLGEGWGGLLYGFWNDSGEYGNWTGTQDHKYLGIKFEIGSEFHYAWIHLTTHQNSHSDLDFTIHSYAYNTIANQMILAGDVGEGAYIDNVTVDKLSIYPNPTKDVVYFKNGINVKDVTIYNANGELISKTKISLLNHSIDLSNYKKGIYLIKIQTESGSVTKRLMKR